MSKYALIGEKLGHSYSKIIHERYFELCGKEDFSYDLIEIPKDNLRQELERICATYDGINVTIPYKLDVMNFIDSISDEAAKIGAVNTIKFSGGYAAGYNTDYFGLKSTFTTNDIEVSGKRVVILGTGGVSKAALAVCRDMGALDITFVSTSAPRLSDYRVLTYNDKIEGDVLINCTPVGMYPNSDASPLKSVSDSFSALVDTIYNPAETKLMKMACAKGIKAVSGLYMLVAQAMYSQAIWQDREVDLNATDTIYKELAKEKQQ